jgi:hypothetical protein
MIALPSWPKVALIGAAVAILATAYATQAVRISLLKRDVSAAAAAEAAASLASAQWEAVAIAERGERAREALQAATTRKVLDEERTLSAAARADADAARGDADQLRAAARRYAATRACPAAANPPAAGGSEPAADPGDLQADVLGGLAEDGAALAAEADRRGIAGLTCWRERAPLTTKE